MEPKFDAERLRENAVRLRMALGTLLSELKSGGGWTARGGMADKARFQVIGPDGKVKQETETD